MATFPANQTAVQQSWVVYLDPAVSILAPVCDAVSGAPLPGSTVIASQEKIWPLFTCAGVSVLYTLDVTGQVTIIRPAVGIGPVVTITGSRSGGAATASLIAALAALGMSVSDGTVA